MSKVIPLLETIFQNRGGSSKLWKATNEVLLQKSDEAKHFCSYMKTKLRDVNKDTQLLALDFLDYSVDDGKMPLWTQISSKDFLSTLISLLKTRDAPEVSVKILFLIEKWGKKFEKYQEIIPNFTDMYKGLKNSGVLFPVDAQSSYSKYIMSDQDLHEYNNNPQNYQEEYQQAPNNVSSSVSSGMNIVKSVPYSQSINVDLRSTSYEKKYRKLVDKLGEWVNDIEIINTNIDNGAGGHGAEKMKSSASSLKHGNKQLIETISSEKLKDERLMEISLGVAEDINRTLKRYDNYIKGRKVEPFLSFFVENSARNSEMKTIKKEPVKSFDILEGFDTSVNQQIQQEPQVNNNQMQSSTTNDLFDLFSNPQTVAPMNNPSNNNQYGFNMMPQQQQLQPMYGIPQQNQQQQPFFKNDMNSFDQSQPFKMQQQDSNNNNNNYGFLNQINFNQPNTINTNPMNMNMGMGFNPTPNNINSFNNPPLNNLYNQKPQSYNMGIGMGMGMMPNNNNYNFQQNNQGQSNQGNQDKLNAIDLLF